MPKVRRQLTKNKSTNPHSWSLWAQDIRRYVLAYEYWFCRTYASTSMSILFCTYLVKLCSTAYVIHSHTVVLLVGCIHKLLNTHNLNARQYIIVLARGNRMALARTSSGKIRNRRIDRPSSSYRRSVHHKYQRKICNIYRKRVCNIHKQQWLSAITGINISIQLVKPLCESRNTMISTIELNLHMCILRIRTVKSRDTRHIQTSKYSVPA